MNTIILMTVDDMELSDDFRLYLSHARQALLENDKSENNPEMSVSRPQPHVGSIVSLFFKFNVS